MDFSEDKSNLVVCAIALVLGLSQAPNLISQWQRGNAIAQASQASLLNNQQLETTKMLKQQEEKIANERYDRGCELLVDGWKPTESTPVREGQPVLLAPYLKLYDRKTMTLDNINPAHTLPPGAVVCDAYGNTAVLKSQPGLNFATMQDLANTPDRDKMRTILANRKVTRPPVGK